MIGVDGVAQTERIGQQRRSSRTGRFAKAMNAHSQAPMLAATSNA